MLKLIGVSVFLATLLLSVPVASKRGDTSPPSHGRSYFAVRHELISKGFRPFRAKNRDTPDEICPGFSSCSAFPEIVYCSGTGIALCESVFFKKRNGRFKKVISYGEGPKLVDGVYDATAREIRDWRFGYR